MLDDEIYDLMRQLVEESKSLYEIKKHYKDDAKPCQECMDFWKKLESQKKDNIQELETLLKEHM